MIKIRLIIISITILFVVSVGLFVSFYARGYRFSFKSLRFEPKGILVIKTDPTGAQVIINGDLKGASDTNFSLTPGNYDLALKKEGFIAWSKRINIEKEVVTEIDASLFSAVPSFSPMTLDGAIDPVPSADYTKIAYDIPATTNNTDKTGLWVIETTNLPIGFAKEPKRVTDGSLIGASWKFSPDASQILLRIGTASYLLPAGSFTPQNQRVNIASTVEKILAGWEKDKATKLSAQMRILPVEVNDILTRKASAVVFSPDESKVLYTASASAMINENLVRPLPGSSTQKQERAITIGRTYIYDIKEDRNFLIYDSPVTITNDKTTGAAIRWFPNSRNLILAENGRISIMDYDGTNRATIYSGAYLAPNAFPFASTSKLVISTNLGADSSIPNLYSLSLK
jgi:hypothetical protein